MGKINGKTLLNSEALLLTNRNCEKIWVGEKIKEKIAENKEINRDEIALVGARKKRKKENNILETKILKLWVPHAALLFYIYAKIWYFGHISRDPICLIDLFFPIYIY